MKYTFRYYVLDTVSETIIGSFFANTRSMAQKIMDTFDFKKANLDPKDVYVYMDPFKSSIFETYDEVMDSIGQECNEFEFQQRVLDFGEDDGKSGN